MYYSYGLLVAKLVMGFVMVIAYLFLSGKTQLTQQSPVDMIGHFIIGGAIGGTVYADDSWDATRDYLLTLFLVLVVIGLIDYLVKRISLLRKVSHGQTLILIRDHQFVMETLQHAEYKIDFSAILSKLHVQGIMAFDELAYLQVEPDGSLVIVQEKQTVPSVMVYSHDTLNRDNLAASGADEVEIQHLIEHFKHEEIVFIEYDVGHYNVMTRQQYHHHAAPFYGTRHEVKHK